MAAVIVTPSRSASPVHPGADRLVPLLRVIPGGRIAERPARLHPAVYRRRRIGLVLAVLTLAVVGYLAVAGARSLVARSSAGPGAVAPAPMQAVLLTPTDAAPAPVATRSAQPVAAPGAVYVVRPGDTLWSIARRLQPDGDVRPVVDTLAARHGGSVLEAGDRIQVDGLDG